MRLKLQKSYIMIKILKKEMISKQVFMDLYMKVKILTNLLVVLIHMKVNLIYSYMNMILNKIKNSKLNYSR